MNKFLDCDWLMKQRNSLRANQIWIRSGPVSSKNRNGWRLQHICICELKNCSKNENTAKCTGLWLSVWKNWCVDKEIIDEIENYGPAELNTLLEHFCAEVNNKKVKIMNQKALK